MSIFEKQNKNIEEVTKEDLIEQKKRSVWTRRIAKIAGIGISAIGTASGCIAASVQIMNKITEGNDEENPAGFFKTAACFGVALAGCAGEMGALYGGAYLIEEEIESWSEDDFKIEEAEVEDEFDPDKRIKFDWE